MAEEKQSLHIDTDWKKQAQEEKRRLAEQAAAKAKESAPVGIAAGAVAGGGGTATPAEARGKGRARGEVPAPSFSTLVQSLLSQALFYLGDYPSRTGEPTLNLDMAKHQIDTLGVLEEKTKGNLTSDEQKLLDTVLYEARMRYVNVASQYT